MSMKSELQSRVTFLSKFRSKRSRLGVQFSAEAVHQVTCPGNSAVRVTSVAQQQPGKHSASRALPCKQARLHLNVSWDAVGSDIAAVLVRVIGCSFASYCSAADPAATSPNVVAVNATSQLDPALDAALNQVPHVSNVEQSPQVQHAVAPTKSRELSADERNKLMAVFERCVLHAQLKRYLS